jgi:hypothetical protein
VELDYSKLVMLDAEELAEQGIADAYQSLFPELSRYVAHPAPLDELIDDDAPSYAVRCAGHEYVVYAPGVGDGRGESWGRATTALFAAVNRQLAGSTHRFYAINGGNDLGGMFLTEAEALAARKALPKKTDWPYLPEPKAPWFGQFH